MSENNFNDVTKGRNTNVFRKLGKSISHFFRETTAGFVLSLLLMCGGVVFAVCAFLIHMDNVNYPEGDYEMTYRVYYTPSNVKEYTVKHNRPMWVSSHRGTNEVYLFNKGTLIETNAPIEVVKYVNHIHIKK